MTILSVYCRQRNDTRRDIFILRLRVSVGVCVEGAAAVVGVCVEGAAT
jgi:hypothetical protein